MSEKISNFLEEAKEIDGRVLPIERDTLVRDIQSVPREILNEYVEAISFGIENLLLWKNIASSTGSTPITKHFIDNLEESQFRRFQRVVLSLSTEEPQKRIKEIIEGTFGYSAYPIPESIPKAKALLNKLKEKGNYEVESVRWATSSKYLAVLSKILFLMGRREDLMQFFEDQLALYPEKDLDRMLEIVCEQ
jgi:hypothetical protein